MSTATLNTRRVYYANRTGKTRTGRIGGFNCWGATLFTLGGRDWRGDTGRRRQGCPHQR